MRDNTFVILMTIHIIMAVVAIMFREGPLVVFVALCWAAELILMIKHVRY